jgi:hypothetical protein
MWIETLPQWLHIGTPSPQPAVSNLSRSYAYSLNCVVSLNNPKLMFYVTYGNDSDPENSISPRQYSAATVIWFSCPDCLMLSAVFWTTGHSIMCSAVCIKCDIAFSIYTDLTHMLYLFLAGFCQERLYETSRWKINTHIKENKQVWHYVKQIYV